MINSNLSILYVEDDIILRDKYVELLKLYFKNVYVSDNGEEALTLYSLYKPNVTILDINIPKINGLKVAKQIREKDQNTILIMLTAYSDKEKLLDAIELNLTKYIIKPIKTFELEEMIINIIQKLQNNQKSTDILLLECDYIWDIKKERLYSKDNQEIKLTKKEQLLVSLFCNNKYTIFSNYDILNHVWEEDEDGYNPNKLRIIFSKLKKKINCNLFDSIYNVGYKLKGNF